MKGNHRAKGFTLVELLVVVLIISMLVAFMAPKVFKGLGKTQKSIARSKMANIESALGIFRNDCGRFPTEEEGLEALLEEPPDIEEDKWNGAYLKRSDIIDPWDNPYVYVEEGIVNEGGFDLISYGADGVESGEGDDADIYND